MKPLRLPPRHAYRQSVAAGLQSRPASACGHSIRKTAAPSGIGLADLRLSGSFKANPQGLLQMRLNSAACRRQSTQPSSRDSLAVAVARRTMYPDGPFAPVAHDTIKSCRATCDRAWQGSAGRLAAEAVGDDRSALLSAVLSARMIPEGNSPPVTTGPAHPAGRRRSG